MEQPKEDVGVTERSIGNRRVANNEFYDKTIPEKFRGTPTDKSEMVVMGKKQVLRVYFPY